MRMYNSFSSLQTSTITALNSGVISSNKAPCVANKAYPVKKISIFITLALWEQYEYHPLHSEFYPSL